MQTIGATFECQTLPFANNILFIISLYLIFLFFFFFNKALIIEYWITYLGFPYKVLIGSETGNSNCSSFLICN